MVCVHLKELYQLCQDHNLRLSGSDLVHVVCKQCGLQEVCPSTLMDEYDSQPHTDDQEISADRLSATRRPDPTS